MKKIHFFVALGWLSLIMSCSSRHVKNDYQGVAYTDSEREVERQVIPGKLQLEFYDRGGEGIAYHDTDSSNRGSGGLNKGTSYFDTFRIDEAVDISYTKFRNAIDNSPYNLVEPKEWQLYVGWTEPGEWLKYTVEVRKTGTYRIGMMYTCNGDGQVALSVADQDITGPVDILTTHVDADTIEWRQWHHWNYLENIAEVELSEGIQTLTLHTVANGQMNFDYLSFELKQ